MKHFHQSLSQTHHYWYLSVIEWPLTVLLWPPLLFSSQLSLILRRRFRHWHRFLSIVNTQYFVRCAQANARFRYNSTVYRSWTANVGALLIDTMHCHDYHCNLYFHYMHIYIFIQFYIQLCHMNKVLYPKNIININMICYLWNEI